MVLEKTFESLLDCKEIQLVHSEGDQSWDFFGRNDAEAEVPVLWTAHANGYYGAWQRWVVSISVLPLTKVLAFQLQHQSFQ